LPRSLNSATVNTHAGFSDANKINAGNFADFVGNVAGEAVNYAGTGTFNLNVLNLGFLAGEEGTALDRLLSTGLLELHLGKEGATMNIGSGGMDALSTI
jgi:hypothetical protein